MRVPALLRQLPLMTRIDLDADVTVGEALSQLGIQTPRPVLVVVGSADGCLYPDQRERIRLMFERAVVPVCTETGAVVIYGGTKAGIMAILGEVMAEFCPSNVLLGIAPKSLVPFASEERSADTADPEPHHTHFLRTPGHSWGSESEFLVRVAERIAPKDDIVMLSMAGGNGTYNELDLAARRRWTIFLATGCDGTTDRTAEVLEASIPAPPMHPASVTSNLSEAHGQDRIRSAPVDDSNAIRRSLMWRLSTDAILHAAWTRFHRMDEVASKSRPLNQAAKASVLILGLIATVAAILAGDILAHFPAHPWVLGVAVAAPFIASIILASQRRRSKEGNWITSRSTAETIRREIYRYRTKSGEYERFPVGSRRKILYPSSTSPHPCPIKDTRQQALAEKLNQIDLQVEGRSALPPPPGTGSGLWPPSWTIAGAVDPQDSLLDDLTGHTYAHLRINDQLAYYSKRVPRAESLVYRLLILGFVIANLTTFMGALAFQFDQLTAWIAVASNISVAVFAWIDYYDADQRGRSMARSAASVQKVYNDWLALPTDQREQPSVVARLADKTEDALGAESLEWNQALQQAQGAFNT